MKTSRMLSWGFIDAVGVAVYTSIVTWIISHAEGLFGTPSTFWGPASFLLLFVISAAVVGSLVFGRPVLLYLAGEKKEAIATFLATIAILILIFLLVLLIQI